MNELVRRISQLERRLDGLVLPERPAWANWTPTVDQGGAVAVTVTLARYMVLGDLAVVQARLDVTGAGNAGNAVIIQGQPSAIQAANNSIVIGHCSIYDAGTGFYLAIIDAIGPTDWRMFRDGETAYVGIAPNFALASSDVIFLHAVYERA